MNDILIIMMDQLMWSVHEGQNAPTCYANRDRDMGKELFRTCPRFDYEVGGHRRCSMS
jgi:hypothetical protein